MLKRYPLVMPQDPSGGKVLLHPTAAITAFLAAFILTVDGVKANSLQEVLVFAGREGCDVISKEVCEHGLSSKSELFKTLVSDHSLTNYNMVILGVALIALSYQ